MTVRVVVFDFGNVVAFFSRQRAAEQMAAFAPAGVSVGEITEFLFYTDLEPRIESGQLAPAEALRLMRARFHLRGTDVELIRAFADMFTPNEPVCQLIPRLKRGYRLALLSNTNEFHYRQFRAQFAETLQHFDLVVTSHEARMRKPDPNIYRLVEKRLKCVASECLFIDDLAENVAAARACGWHGIVYQVKDDLLAQLRQAGVEVA